MTFNHKTYSDLIRLCSYANGALCALMMQIEDDNLRKRIYIIHNDVSQILSNIMEKAHED